MAGTWTVTAEGGRVVITDADRSFNTGMFPADAADLGAQLVALAPIAQAQLDAIPPEPPPPSG
jgi:hypothetical protein